MRQRSDSFAKVSPRYLPTPNCPEPAIRFWNLVTTDHGSVFFCISIHNEDPPPTALFVLKTLFTQRLFLVPGERTCGSLVVKIVTFTRQNRFASLAVFALIVDEVVTNSVRTPARSCLAVVDQDLSQCG